MTFDKVLEALEKCDAEILKEYPGLVAVDIKVVPRPPSVNRQASHLRYMIAEIKKWDASRIEKAFRWLGFIQGAMWSQNICGIEELKEMNRP